MRPRVRYSLRYRPLAYLSAVLPLRCRPLAHLSAILSLRYRPRAYLSASCLETETD